MTAVHPSVLLARPSRPSRHPIHVLHLEDNEADGAVVRLYLERQGFGDHVVQVYDRAGFLEHLTGDVDIVLADHSMPGFDSFEALRLVQAHCPGVPLIIVSGKITEEAAVGSIKSGAADYIWKDRLQRLRPAIEHALREKRHQTEHEAALRATRESEALSHAVLSSLSQLICVLGPDGVIVTTNTSWKSAGAARGTNGLDGLDVGTNYLDVCRRSAAHGDDLAHAALDGITAVLAGEQGEFSLEYPCHAPTGRAWYTLCATPLGGGLGAVLSHQSITDLRGTQESLSQNQTRLKAIFEGSLDAIMLADDEGRYVDVNPAAAALLGYTREGLVGLSVRDITVPEHQDAAAEGWATFRAAGRASGEFTVMRKDGAFVPTEFSATADVLPGLHLSILRDITERRAAAAELARNQVRMKSIFEGSLDAILLADDDGRYVDANPAASALLGYSRDEFLEMGVTDVLSIPSDQGFGERWAALRARGTDSRAFKVYRKDGTAVDVEQRATFNVLPGLHLSIIRDVTERKAVAAALAEASRRNAEILESIDDGFFALDADWRMTYVNGEAERLLGKGQGSLSGRSIWDALPEGRGTVFQSEFERARRDDVTVRFTAVGPVSGRWIDVRAFPYEGGITVYFHDVTEEKLAKIALRESEERLQLVSRATNDAVWDWDVSTGAAVMNEAFTEVFGWQAPADGGFTIGWILERVHPDERARVTASAFEAFKGGGQGWRAEYRFERADGTWADVVTQGYIVRSPDGWAVRVVGTMLDLTARKATERALVEAKEAAEEIARAKSSLLMNMSHEIRTPLTAVIGYAELLGDECGPEQTAQREYAAIIENGGRRLLDTLNSVLDLAQIEAGVLPLATVAVDLWAEAEAAIAALQPLARANGLALALTGSPTAARADRAALARVLTNLVGNAIKFTERGTVAVDVWAEGGSAWLQVTDTGVGIDPEFLPHVFDDFKQESSGDNRSYEGSGLGLAISRGLVTTMGGEISAASEKGVGSTFTVRLPAA